MDILYLLIPLSVVLVLFVLAGLWWAVYRGQFENVEQEGVVSGWLCLNLASGGRCSRVRVELFCHV